jgi:DNA-binding NarL/FixJ family response regulator
VRKGRSGGRAATRKRRSATRARTNELAELVRAGAFAFVPKRAAAGDLLAIIRSVARGSVPPPAVPAARVIPDSAGPIGDVRLTPREREICAYLVAGLPVPRIARRLNLSPPTLHRYLRRIRAAFRHLAPKD